MYATLRDQCLFCRSWCYLYLSKWRQNEKSPQSSIVHSLPSMQGPYVQSEQHYLRLCHRDAVIVCTGGGCSKSLKMTGSIPDSWTTPRECFAQLLNGTNSRIHRLKPRRQSAKQGPRLRTLQSATIGLHLSTVWLIMGAGKEQKNMNRALSTLT